jgi:hypothetical protein
LSFPPNLSDFLNLIWIYFACKTIRIVTHPILQFETRVQLQFEVDFEKKLKNFGTTKILTVELGSLEAYFSSWSLFSYVVVLERVFV